jgi:hypothetical protein
MRFFTRVQIQLLAIAALAALLLSLAGCSRDDKVIWQLAGKVSPAPAMPEEVVR